MAGWGGRKGLMMVLRECEEEAELFIVNGNSF